MYNTYGFNPQMSVDRINNQIKELEQLKNQYQNIPQVQPINNIINTNTPNIDFEARFVKDDELVEDIIIQRKTAFISPKNGYLKIKDLNGNIETYELIPPLDEKDIKIKELEEKINELSSNIKSVDKCEKSYECNNVNVKPTTKANGK